MKSFYYDCHRSSLRFNSQRYQYSHYMVAAGSYCFHHEFFAGKGNSILNKDGSSFNTWTLMYCELFNIWLASFTLICSKKCNRPIVWKFLSLILAQNVNLLGCICLLIGSFLYEIKFVQMALIISNLFLNFYLFYLF